MSSALCHCTSASFLLACYYETLNNHSTSPRSRCDYSNFNKITSDNKIITKHVTIKSTLFHLLIEFRHIRFSDCFDRCLTFWPFQLVRHKLEGGTLPFILHPCIQTNKQMRNILIFRCFPHIKASIYFFFLIFACPLTSQTLFSLTDDRCGITHAFAQSFSLTEHVRLLSLTVDCSTDLHTGRSCV